MRDSLVGQRLAWGFLLGLVLLNDPVLSLFDRGQHFSGLPVVYLYLFAVWGGLIGFLAWVLAADRRPDGDSGSGSGD